MELGIPIKTTDGGYLFVGESKSGISGDKTESSRGKSDFWVVKTDSYAIKCYKTFGGSGDDYLRSAIPTNDGGYLLPGNSDSNPSGEKSQWQKGAQDFWVVKIDSNGTKIWDKTFGGSGNDICYDVAHTADGGYLLGGHSDSGISGDKTENSRGENDFWVVKIDENGTKLWDRSYGGNVNDMIYTIEATQDGGFILEVSRTLTLGDKTENSRGGYDSS